MKSKLTILLIAIFLLSFRVLAEDPITLEHTFDGYYLPHNFPIYEEDDNERYFYSPSITPSGKPIVLETYNEDYSLRDHYSVNYDSPSGYSPYAATFSSSLKLSDGTPFFIVVFMRNEPYNGIYYYNAQMFNAITGEMIAELGTSAGFINIQGNIYEINGKPSIVVVFYRTDTSSYKTYYTTKIYSLGTPSPVEVNVPNKEKRKSEPLRTFDMNGREITHPIVGQPYIYQMDDGTSNVRINTK